MIFTLTQSLGLALNAQCGEDQACLDAVEQQLETCIENNKDLDALIDAGGADDELTNRVIQDLSACIVDEEGESYFYQGTDESEYVNDALIDEPDRPKSLTTIPR